MEFILQQGTIPSLGMEMVLSQTQLAWPAFKSQAEQDTQQLETTEVITHCGRTHAAEVTRTVQYMWTAVVRSESLYLTCLSYRTCKAAHMCRANRGRMGGFAPLGRVVGTASRT